MKRAKSTTLNSTKIPGDSEGSCSPCVLAALTSGFAGIRRDCSDFVGEGEIGQISSRPNKSAGEGNFSKFWWF